MKNEIIMKVMFCVGCLGFILFLDSILVQTIVTERISLVDTYVAAKDIPPRTCISEEDIVEIRIPKRYLMDNTYNDPSEIIGKYTEIQGTIPAGSVFYKHMLFDESELPDQAVLQLKEGETVYTTDISIADCSSLTVGERVDIYAEINERDGFTLTGCLFRNVRIISIKDHAGLSIEDEESSGVPFMIELAIRREDIECLSTAINRGKIRYYPSEDPYSTENDATIVKDSKIYEYLFAEDEKKTDEQQ